MRVDAIVFDKDGTLFDFATTWSAWAQGFLLLAAAGDRDRARMLGRHIGFDLDAARFADDSIAIAGTSGQVADALAPHRFIQI